MVRERYCRQCRRRFYTESDDGPTELHCGNPFVSRARTGYPAVSHAGQVAQRMKPPARRGATASPNSNHPSGKAKDDCETYG